MSIFKDQADFMSNAGQLVTGHECTTLRYNQVELYSNLISEEASEFEEAVETVFESAEAIKEAVDVIVVAAGYLISVLGTDGAQKAWNAVHESNLRKLHGCVGKREDGKILKNDLYKKVAKAEMMQKLEELLYARDN